MSIASLGHNNVNAVIANLLKMSPPQRQQFAQAHAEDPLMLSAAKFVDNEIKKQAQAYLAQQNGTAPAKINEQVVQSMGPQTPQPQAQPQGQPQTPPPPQAQPQPQAAQALPENTGIAQLPAQSIQKMAGGGIVAFADRGAVRVDPFAEALDLEGVTDPRQIAYLKSIYGQESSGGKNPTTSNRGAVGGMQILPETFSGVADRGMNIKNPVDNARAGIRYALQGYELAKGDPKLAATYYYGGPKGFDKAQKSIAVSDPVNPKAPTTLGYGKEVADRMTKLMPIGTAQAAEVKSKSSVPETADSDIEYSDPMGFTMPKSTGAISTPAPKKAPTAAKPAAPTKPWYDRYREALTSGEGQRQMLLGAGDMPYDLLGAPADIGSDIGQALGYQKGESYLGSKNLKRLATEYLGREADAPDPTMQGMRTVGGIAALGVNPVSAVNAVATTRGAGLASEALAARKEAEAAAALAPKKVVNYEGKLVDQPRLENPMGSSTIIVNPAEVASSEGRVKSVLQLNADKAAAAETAAAAQKAAAAAKGSLTAEQYAQMAARATQAGNAARGTALAAKVGSPESGDLLRSIIPAAPTPAITGADRTAG
jgi:hypothetical protein